MLSWRRNTDCLTVSSADSVDKPLTEEQSQNTRRALFNITTFNNNNDTTEVEND